MSLLRFEALLFVRSINSYLSDAYMDWDNLVSNMLSEYSSH